MPLSLPLVSQHGRSLCNYLISIAIAITELRLLLIHSPLPHSHCFRLYDSGIAVAIAITTLRVLLAMLMAKCNGYSYAMALAMGKAMW